MNSKVELMSTGSPRLFTSVGGYPIAYVCAEGVLCPSCTVHEPEESDPQPFVNWENDDLACDECGETIECAYSGEEG